MNKRKTKVMILNRNRTNIKDVGGFAVIEKIIYLGNVLTNNGGCDDEIKRRVAIAQNSCNNKLNSLETLIFSIATYASET